MPASTRMREYLRQNLLGLVAIYLALGGGALALQGQDRIDHDDLQAHVVHRGQIHDRAVSGAKLADDSVNSSKVADNSLTGVDIKEASLSAAVLQRRIGTACPIGQAIRSVAATGAVTCEGVGAGGPPSGPAGGDLAGSYPNPSIANGAVTGPKIDDFAIFAPKLADQAVITSKLAFGAVTGPRLASNSVDSAKVVDKSLTGADVGFGEARVTFADSSSVIGPFPGSPPGALENEWSTISTGPLPAGAYAAFATVDYSARTHAEATCTLQASDGPGFDQAKLRLEEEDTGGIVRRDDTAMLAFTTSIPANAAFDLICDHDAGFFVLLTDRKIVPIRLGSQEQEAVTPVEEFPP